MSNKTKNLKVFILIGLPGSGKSTWAKEFIRKNENFVRISRDGFRFMLKEMPVCEPKIEDLITDLVATTAIKALNKKQNIILDNTHLKAKYINPIVKLVEEYADVEFMLFDVSVEKCIERDKLRERIVGEDVIKKLNKDFKNLKETFLFQNQSKKEIRTFIKPNFKSELPPTVIFDIDGTLALMGRRGPFDWQKVDVDEFNDIVGEQVKFHKSLGRTIIILSGRDSSCKNLTEEWLKFHKVEYNHIFMRGTNDYRKDSIIKKELYENNIKDKFNVLCIYDDRLQVVKMWYELGIFVYNVNQGNKEF